MFTGQAWQALSAVAATVVEYVLTLQLVHTIFPLNLLNLPGTHAVHVPPSNPLYPDTHMHSVKSIDPALEIELAGQAVHAAEPEAFLNVPAAQRTHVWPSEPVAPGLHRQSVCAAEPSDEFEFAGQA